MQRITVQMRHTLALVLAGILATGSAFADPPPWAGGNKQGKHEQEDRGDSQKGQGRDKHGKPEQQDRGDSYKERGRDKHDGRESVHFSDQNRIILHDYYAEQFHSGRCPPGLAKKHNGCMPPGQAKKWALGRPLPRDVVYYDLPRTVLVQLDPPPSGHRYVRVASDILLIAVGTGMVVDAIQDLNR